MSHRLYTNTSCVFYCSLLFYSIISIILSLGTRRQALCSKYGVFFVLLYRCWKCNALLLICFCVVGMFIFFFYSFAYYTNEWVFGSEERSGWFSHYEADHTSFPIVEWLLSILVSFYFWSGPWIYLSDGRLQAQTLSE